MANEQVSPVEPEVVEGTPAVPEAVETPVIPEAAEAPVAPAEEAPVVPEAVVPLEADVGSLKYS
jgi:hypothetical protein